MTLKPELVRDVLAEKIGSMVTISGVDPIYEFLGLTFQLRGVIDEVHDEDVFLLSTNEDTATLAVIPFSYITDIQWEV